MYEGHLLCGTKAAILGVWGLSLFVGTCLVLATLEVTDNDVTPREYRRIQSHKKAPWFKKPGDRGDFLVYEEPKRTRFPTFSQEIESGKAHLDRWERTHANSARLNLSHPRPYRILIASLALIGPVTNGGIGTAYSNLAAALVSEGHEVTLLYLWGDAVQSKTFGHWVRYYKERGIELIGLPKAKINLSPSIPSMYVSLSYRTYEFLKSSTKSYDLFHFHEWHGAGYYTAMAKKQGLAFQDTQIWTTIHCPSLFFMHGNFGYLNDNNNLASDYLERSQVAMSDVVVSPSEFMLQWVQGRGWELPPRTYAQQNILSQQLIRDAADPGKLLQDAGRRVLPPGSISEIVFFGRLEVLKGIGIFCDALDILARTAGGGLSQWHGLKRVTFLGHKNLGSVDAEEYVTKRSAAGRWGLTVAVLDNLIQPEAVKYVKEAGRLCVMPSVLENSPYTVLETLALRIPFIVSNVGGVPELIDREDHESALFEPEPEALAAHLERALRDGARIPRAQTRPRDNLREYLDYHKILAARTVPEVVLRPTSPAAKKRGRRRDDAGDYHPLVTVALVHHNRGEMMLKTLEGILSQDYWPFEIVLVDDGSNDQAAIRVLGEVQRFFNRTRIPFRFVRTPNRFPGAARNTAAETARGKYVVFCDDDDVPKPGWVSTLVRVAHRTHADVVTSMADTFHGDSVPPPGSAPDARWLSVGPAADLGMYYNVFGSSQALVRKKSFFKIGGFSEEGRSTFEDWEFFATAVLKGYNLQSVPEALSWYRQRPKDGKDNLMATTNVYTNRLRALRPYQKAIPPPLRNAVLFGWGMARTKRGVKSGGAKGMGAGTDPPGKTELREQTENTTRHSAASE